MLETLYSVFRNGEYDTIEVEGDDDEVTEELIAIITVKYTSIFGTRASVTTCKMELDSDDLIAALKWLSIWATCSVRSMVSISDGILRRVSNDEEYSAAAQAANIKKALADMEEELEGLHYDPNGPHVFPLQGYTNPPTSWPLWTEAVRILPMTHFIPELTLHRHMDTDCRCSRWVVLFRVQANRVLETGLSFIMETMWQPCMLI